MPEARKLTQRQRDQRERVLDATRQMLAEDGYEGLQMRALAARANVSLMTLYNRFGNKDDLILLALRDMLAELAERARASGKQGIEFQLHNAAMVAEQILATPAYAEAMSLMLFNGRVDSPIVKTLLTDNVAEARERLDRMLELGDVTAAVDLDLVARRLAVAGWATNLLWMKGVVPDSELVREYRRASLLVLAPVMTERARARYAEELQ